MEKSNKETKQKNYALFNAHTMPAQTRDLLLIWPQNRPERHQRQLCYSRLASTHSHSTLSSHPKQLRTTHCIVTVSQLQTRREPG